MRAALPRAEKPARSLLAWASPSSQRVNEIGNSRVQVFDKEGRFIAAWGRKGSGDGEFGNLHGIIIDKPSGTVYVADTANNRIQVFKPVDAGTVGASAPLPVREK